MHHKSASKYYKYNISFLLLFFGFSFYTYYSNSEIFWNPAFANLYLGIIASGIMGAWLFSHK
jgi:hypothetical protein